MICFTFVALLLTPLFTFQTFAVSFPDPSDFAVHVPDFFVNSLDSQDSAEDFQDSASVKKKIWVSTKQALESGESTAEAGGLGESREESG